MTDILHPGQTTLLEVEVDNTISHHTLPVGNEGGTAFFGSDNAGIPAVEAGKARQQAQGINLPNFDFFNYAGITKLMLHLSVGKAASEPKSKLFRSPNQRILRLPRTRQFS